MNAIDRQLARHRPIAPRGLKRLDAAAYISVSGTKFDQMIADGSMPKPRKVGSRRVWDVQELDRAFDALPHDGDDRATNPWDDDDSV